MNVLTIRSYALAILPLLMACGQPSGSAFINHDSNSADPGLEASPTPSPSIDVSAICPDDTVHGYSYADAPREFCLDISVNAGAVGLITTTYVDAENRCEALHRKVCDTQELMGGSRDGHLPAGQMLWIYSQTYDRMNHAQQSTGVFDSTAGQQMSTGYVNGGVPDKHNFYCCQSPERP